MRADRLLELMLHLQTRSRLTAADLADRLGVSVRTIHRDLDALSASGVPVYATRGPNGGVALLEGWRTHLTGFTEPEIQALAALRGPGALDDLGLSSAFRTGVLKLAAALPAAQRATAEHARQRLHVDASGWFAAKEPTVALGVLREAVWQDRKVRLAYVDFDGARSNRVVEPLGLVIKSDRWYLVAGTARGTTVFRVSRVLRASLLEQTFVRPEGFDLERSFEEWSRRFATKRPSFEVRLHLGDEAASKLRELRPAIDRARIDAARPARDGRRAVVIDFERESIAIAQIVATGPGAVVVDPEPLRARLRAIGEELRAVYGPPRRQRAC